LHLIHEKPGFRLLVTCLFLAIGPLAACGNGPDEAEEAQVAEKPVSTCADSGTLQAVLSGAVVATLNWPDEALRCESMPRPDAAGVRLRFSGEVDAQRLAIIIALPDLDPGETGGEFDSNVTVSVEGSGRFFSTPNLDTCWTDIAVNKPVDDGSSTHNVVGTLSCVAPLGELNGDGFVDVQSLRFSGIANWGPQPVAGEGTLPELDDSFEFATLEIINDAGAHLELDVYLAQDFDQHRRGLMFVRDMPETTGMLFIYDNDEIRSIWMKNTYIPLDIVFARSDGTVSSIDRDATPLTLNSRQSTEPARFVLELNGGTTRRLGIGPGSQLIWGNDERE
jgi:uncharacterized membrane protein (UPF0127 family)